MFTEHTIDGKRAIYGADYLALVEAGLMTWPDDCVILVGPLLRERVEATLQDKPVAEETTT